MGGWVVGGRGGWVAGRDGLVLVVDVVVAKPVLVLVKELLLGLARVTTLALASTRTSTKHRHPTFILVSVLVQKFPRY